MPGFEAAGLDRPTALAAIRRSVALAQRARDRVADETGRSTEGLLVAGSVGPYGAMLADGSEYRGDYDPGATALADFHRPRIEALLEAGVDLLAFETIPTIREAEVLVRLLAEPGATAWLSYSCRDAPHLGRRADRGGDCARDAPGVVAVGVNCTAPRHLPGLLTAAAAVTDRPLIAYPNRGDRWDPAARPWIAEATRRYEPAMVARGPRSVRPGSSAAAGPDPPTSRLLPPSSRRLPPDRLRGRPLGRTRRATSCAAGCPVSASRHSLRPNAKSTDARAAVTVADRGISRRRAISATPIATLGRGPQVSATLGDGDASSPAPRGPGRDAGMHLVTRSGLGRPRPVRWSPGLMIGSPSRSAARAQSWSAEASPRSTLGLHAPRARSGPASAIRSGRLRPQDARHPRLLPCWWGTGAAPGGTSRHDRDQPRSARARETVRRVIGRSRPSPVECMVDRETRWARVSRPRSSRCGVGGSVAAARG